MTKNTPELRFKGFTDDWELRKFNSLVIRLNKSTNSNKLPKVEFEDIVSGEGRLNKDVSQKFDNRKGIEFLPNDILYGKLRPYLKNWIKPSFTGVALGDFWVFRAHENNSDFIYSLIQANKYQRVANDTSGTKMPRSDWKKVSETEFLVPHIINEQKKIGIFFKQFDNTIALHQRKLDLLKQLKQAYLQKMFPKNGEKMPEMRFAHFKEEWTQYKLSELATHRGGTAIEKYFSDSGEYKVISIGSYGLDNKYVDQGIRAVSNKITNKRLVKKNELTMVLNDKTANGSIIGRCLIIDSNNRFVINQRTEIISPQENFDPSFAYTILNGPFRENIKKVVQGGTQIYINYSVVENLSLSVPSIKEQEKIGELFKQFDNIITLHQKKFRALKTIKEAFLSKLFI